MTELRRVGYCVTVTLTNQEGYGVNALCYRIFLGEHVSCYVASWFINIVVCERSLVRTIDLLDRRQEIDK